MAAFDVARTKWIVKLAPHLTGEAQQAYAALSAEEAKDSAQVKEAILHCYNINEETYYCQCFWSASQSLIVSWLFACKIPNGNGLLHHVVFSNILFN